MLKKFCVLLLALCLLPVPAHAEASPPYVAITFDDGPSGRFTRALLDGLDERQVKATFLLCGYRMKQFPAITQRIYDSGHEIGLHGYSHASMARMSAAQVMKEIRETKQYLPDGCECAFLRPPGGAVSSAVRSAARESDLAILSWNVDPRDWATSHACEVESAVLSCVKDGDVILLHDMSDSSVEAALVIIDTLRAQGFEFVTVSELAALRGVALSSGSVYSRFPSG